MRTKIAICFIALAATMFVDTGVAEAQRGRRARLGGGGGLGLRGGALGIRGLGGGAAGIRRLGLGGGGGEAFRRNRFRGFRQPIIIQQPFVQPYVQPIYQQPFVQSVYQQPIIQQQQYVQPIVDDCAVGFQGYSALNDCGCAGAGFSALSGGYGAAGLYGGGSTIILDGGRRGFGRRGFGDRRGFLGGGRRSGFSLGGALLGGLGGFGI